MTEEPSTKGKETVVKILISIVGAYPEVSAAAVPAERGMYDPK